MAKNNDFAVALGSEQSEQQLDYFFDERSESKQEETEPQKGEEGGEQTPRQRGKKVTASTHIRVSLEHKEFLEQCLCAYYLTTKKTISLSEFLVLCVRRALPHISKETADLIRQLDKQ